MTTFSQLVDKMILETRRADLRDEVVSYLNQTIREVHFEPTRGSAAFYLDNRRCDQATATVESGFSWSLPNPHLFQSLEAVRYDNVWDSDGHRVYPKILNPGRRMETEDYFAYRAGPMLFFGGRCGYGGVGAKISISWFEYPPSLKWIPANERPAQWDDETGWTYLPASDVDDSTREAARAKCSNWILDRWSILLEEGLRAKVYKRVSDDPRATKAYSAYMALRNGLYTSEVAEITGAQ